jgi:hypothetical protein
MSRGSIILSTLLLSMVLIWPTVGWTGGITDVTNYFKPANGLLAAIQGDDYIVNLDASSGVMVGDLLSIVTPGEELVDPSSGAVLGSLDTVKGILKITRVRSGFSHASPLGEISKAQIGDSVRRYQNLTAAFQDRNGAGSAMYSQLVSALPSLEWQGYYPVQVASDSSTVSSGEHAQLIFILTDSSLRVQNSAGQLIRSFPVVDQSTVVEQAAVLARAPVPVAVVAPIPQAAPVVPSPTVAWEQQPSQKNLAQVEYSAEYPGYLTLGEFPGIVLMADFTVNDGQQLVASSDGSTLNVFIVTDQMQRVASEKNVYHGNIHAVAWWRPEVDGPLYLAVTASMTKDESYGTTAETIFTSSVYRFADGQLTPVVHSLPYLLGTFDRDSDGHKETLLGQSFDLDTVYGPIRELKLGRDGLDDFEPDLELPLSFPVQGSLLADLTGDGKTETIYTRKGILYIISNGKLQYESSRQMGGSLSQLTYDVNPGQADALFSSVAFEVPQVVADIDGDGRPELIAVSAESSVFRMPGLDSGGGESWLSVIKYQNGRFVKGTLGEKLEKPIQGLTVSQGTAMIVMSRKDSILSGQGQSYLLALPLAPHQR